MDKRFLVKILFKNIFVSKNFVFLQSEKWGFSSSGRALGSQSKGGRFESGILHKTVGVKWFFT